MDFAVGQRVAQEEPRAIVFRQCVADIQIKTDLSLSKVVELDLGEEDGEPQAELGVQEVGIRKGEEEAVRLAADVCREVHRIAASEEVRLGQPRGQHQLVL